MQTKTPRQVLKLFATMGCVSLIVVIAIVAYLGFHATHFTQAVIEHGEPQPDAGTLPLK